MKIGEQTKTRVGAKIGIPSNRITGIMRHGIWMITSIVIVLIGVIAIPERTNGAVLFQTTLLERYMVENYDMKGFNGYTFVIAIEQPIPGNRQAVTENLNTGHAFVRLSKSGTGGWTSYLSYTAGKINEKYEAIGSINIHKDAKNVFTIAKVFEVQEAQAINMLDYMWKRYRVENKTYNLSNNNCITFAMELAKEAGIEADKLGIVPRNAIVPDSIKNNILLQGIISKNSTGYYGFTCGDAGEDLKAKGGCILYDEIANQ